MCANAMMLMWRVEVRITVEVGSLLSSYFQAGSLLFLSHYIL